MVSAEDPGAPKDPVLSGGRILAEVTDRPPIEWLRIYDGPRCVAMAKVRRSFYRAVVHFITTHPRYRGRGLARTLVQSLQEGCEEVIARGVNHEARGFWRRLAFERQGLDHHYLWRRDAEVPGSQGAREPHGRDVEVPGCPGTRESRNPEGHLSKTRARGRSKGGNDGK